MFADLNLRSFPGPPTANPNLHATHQSPIYNNINKKNNNNNSNNNKQ